MWSSWRKCQWKQLPMRMTLPSLEYAGLKNLAKTLLRREKTCTLTCTGLVHELLLKEARTSGSLKAAAIGVKESRLDMRVAQRIMRQLLIDRARRRQTRQRCEELSATFGASRTKDRASEFVLALDDAIAQLSALEPTGAELLRLHFFAGVSFEDAGAQLGLSRATAYRKWDFCRCWLAAQLKKENLSES